jgi:hypothetical protein
MMEYIDGGGSGRGLLGFNEVHCARLLQLRLGGTCRLHVY